MADRTVKMLHNLLSMEFPFSVEKSKNDFFFLRSALTRWVTFKLTWPSVFAAIQHPAAIWCLSNATMFWVVKTRLFYKRAPIPSSSETFSRILKSFCFFFVFVYWRSFYYERFPLTLSIRIKFFQCASERDDEIAYAELSARARLRQLKSQ